MNKFAKLLEDASEDTTLDDFFNMLTGEVKQKMVRVSLFFNYKTADSSIRSNTKIGLLASITSNQDTVRELCTLLSTNLMNQTRITQ